MDFTKLRAWWSHRQGLDGSLMGASPAEVLSRSGWARSVGGVGPYLTLFSRAAISRGRADKAVKDLEIHELPCARGCTYVVPASDFAVALKVGQGFSDEAAMNTARKFLGVTDAEIDSLNQRVLEVLGSEALDPKEIKDRVGDAVRNLGEEGKKRGQTTTLPLSLGFLQSRGEIRRVPVDGRLDQQRYKYVRWDPSPLSGANLEHDAALRQLAEMYFGWIGPAKREHFQWFSGLGVGKTKEIIAEMGLADLGEGWLLPDSLTSEFDKFQVPEEPQYVLASSLDSLILHRRDLASHVEPADVQRHQVGDKGLQTLGGVQDLFNHAIFDRGRLVGLWEYDQTGAVLAVVTFVERTLQLEAAINQAEAFIRDELGDARSFSLDSPESRAPRIAAIRQLATG